MYSMHLRLYEFQNRDKKGWQNALVAQKFIPISALIVQLCSKPYICEQLRFTTQY